MINVGGIIVDADFDSGEFMNSFSICKYSISYDEVDVNIQKAYNLTKQDFNNLSTLIAVTVAKYLNQK